MGMVTRKTIDHLEIVRDHQDDVASCVNMYWKARDICFQDANEEEQSKIQDYDEQIGWAMRRLLI